MKVLIVDDYYAYAVTLKDRFEMEGHIAQYCLNSTIAVAMALEFKPDWVVLDVRMPYKLGVDVYRELSESADFPFSAVFYTNYFIDIESMDEFKNPKIPDAVIIPKTTDMNDDVINKLIPVLEAGYLRGGRKDE